MSRSKKTSLGFQVINTHTGEPDGPIFPTRAPAQERAAFLTRDSHGTFGVKHLEDYISEEEHKTRVAAKKEKAGWRTALVRTPAYDKAANKAFLDARKKQKALDVAWGRESNAGRISGDYAKKLELQSAEQATIIEAARAYAQLPAKSGSPAPMIKSVHEVK